MHLRDRPLDRRDRQRLVARRAHLIAEVEALDAVAGEVEPAVDVREGEWLADALGYEHRRGRAHRIERGVYGVGELTPARRRATASRPPRP